MKRSSGAAQAGAVFFSSPIGSYQNDAALTPHDAAAADRGVEYRKMVPGHGWLRILLFNAAPASS
jgi:hypothetical protein